MHIDKQNTIYIKIYMYLKIKLMTMSVNWAQFMLTALAAWQPNVLISNH